MLQLSRHVYNGGRNNMQQISSEDRKRIEAQMGTAINVVNNLVEFNLDIHIDCDAEYSELTFSQENINYKLPILYVTTSIQSQITSILESIQQESSSEISGIFVVKFHGEDCAVQNATTYTTTIEELYKDITIDETGTSVNVSKITAYHRQIHIFDVAQVTDLLERMKTQDLTMPIQMQKSIESPQIPVEELLPKPSMKVKEEPHDDNVKIPASEVKTVEVIQPKKKETEVVKPEVLETKVDKKDQESIHNLILDLFN